MSGHTLHAVMTRYGPRLDVACHEPVGSWCRMRCPASCEEWYHDHDSTEDHKLVDSGECLAAESLDGDTYSGPDTTIRDGMPVTVEWDEGFWMWSACRESDGGDR